MHLTLVDYAFWCTAMLTAFAVVIVMYHRRLHKDYFWFFGYIVFISISQPILWILNANSYTAYYYGYYVNLELTVLLGIGVLHDVVINAFTSRTYSRRPFTILLWGSAGVFVFGFLKGVCRGDVSLLEAFVATDSVVRIASCALLLFLLLLGWRSRLSLTSLPFGIALGYGGFASLNLCVSVLLHQRAGWSLSSLSRLNSSAYCLATLIWLGYVIWARDREGNPMPPAHRASSARSRSVMYRIVPRGQRFLRDMADGLGS